MGGTLIYSDELRSFYTVDQCSATVPKVASFRSVVGHLIAHSLQIVEQHCEMFHRGVLRCL